MYICDACLNTFYVDEPQAKPDRSRDVCEGCEEVKECNSFALGVLTSRRDAERLAILSAAVNNLDRGKVTIDCQGVGDEWTINAEIHGGPLDSDELGAVVNLIGSRLAGHPAARTLEPEAYVEIKPCSSCGHMPRFVKTTGDCYSLECGGCRLPCGSARETLLGAVESWNQYVAQA